MTMLRRLRSKVWHACAALGLACMGCQTAPVLDVPLCAGPFEMDGRLLEPAYETTAPLTDFVVAGQPDKPAAPTQAWVFWSPDELVFAFRCEDATPVANAPTANEDDVDPQDRVELFLWSGKPEDTYCCLEIAPLGAVHDYAARFYRRFDSAWSPAAWRFAALPAADGYCVEAALSREALRQCGFALEDGAHFRAGLFRADFASWDTACAPDWICWVDARAPQPDFHVAESFGVFRLSGAKRE